MKSNDIKENTKPMSLLSLILSFMALFVISGLLFFPLDAETQQVLIGLDFIICSIFLLQLSVDLIRAADKRQYLKTHWIDILASLPMIEPLRFARLFHILRVILVLRSSRFILNQLKENRKETTIATILLLLVVLVTIGSGMMLFIEGKNPASNIQTGTDALWWAFVTISTVGYGDHYPVTDGGKLLAVVIIMSGVGLFGMISGLITSILTTPSKQQTNRAINKEKMLETLLEQQHEILERLKRLEEQQKK
ncbi:potassium channel family protein [Vibrio vulnificus]|nr:potassium channel family protein [Vibrio vulnificus]EIU7058437.1 potassium channel family protein [Vibrio vulnificus]ELE1960659.1 potassium channel family protein [Vibrio vulnificus]MCU8139245.1 potassium channel family protein [Vibrio vulnificus]